MNINDLNPKKRFIEKFWNTYIRFPLPWMYRRSTSGHWASQAIGDLHGPDKFLQLTNTSDKLIERVCELAPCKESKLLDLGCNVGRHMNALWNIGFRNLSGVDIQSSAIEMMAREFPTMFECSSVHCESFEEFLPKVPNDTYDLVFTHGATIELVTPRFPICDQIARVTKSTVVLIINESGHYYPRLWEHEFLRSGFLLTELKRPVIPGDPSSLLVFNSIRE